MPSTPSSPDADSTRRSRRALIVLVVVSLAIPAGILVWVWHDNGSSGTDPTTIGTIVGTPKKAKIGSVAPDFTLPDLNGNPVTLSKLRGKPVVLSFFASWCHPCEEDMPLLQKLADAGKVTVIGVNYQDVPSDTADFVHRLKTTFPALVEDSHDNPVAARYDVHAMPDTVFIDAQGVVRDRIYGQTDTKTLADAIDRLSSAS